MTPQQTNSASSNAIDVMKHMVEKESNESQEQLSSPPPASEELKTFDSETTGTVRNVTSKSLAYSSASRNHIRLKMSGNSTGLPVGLRSAKMPSLLQRLPCFSSGGPKSPSASSGSFASAITDSALSVIEKVDDESSKDTEKSEDEDISKQLPIATEQSDISTDSKSQEESSLLSLNEEDKASIGGMKEDAKNVSPNASQTDVETSKTLVAPPAPQAQLDLDSIDLDDIQIGDLQGLDAADADFLRAKCLNKLSRKEREHVLQDIHGVADLMEESSRLFVEESLEEFEIEVIREVAWRKKNNASDKSIKQKSNKEDVAESQQEENQEQQIPELEEKLGKLQSRLDQLVRCRKNLNHSMNTDTDSFPKKQLSAKNHPMFGKMGEIGRGMNLPFGSSSSLKNKDMRENIVKPMLNLSSGLSSPFFSPTTDAAFSPAANESQEDAADLISKDATAYEQALAQCRRRSRNSSLFSPSISDGNDIFDDDRYIDVDQRGFRLSFLRAERYNTKKAAKRLLDHFEEKRRLFGVGYLTSKIQLKDLDRQTKDCLESGQIQLLPERDRAGRAVIVITSKLAINSEDRQYENSVLRAFWILASIALEDKETETKGAVVVNYNIGGSNSDHLLGVNGQRRRVRQWKNTLNALPLRVASFHWCVENLASKQATYLSALMLGGSNFVRVRCHAGSDNDVQHDLMTFGIPIDLFPVSMASEVNLSHHSRFLSKRKKSEASVFLNKALALIEAPLLDDSITMDMKGDEQFLEPAIDPSPGVATGGDTFATAQLLTSGNLSSYSPNINFQQEQQEQLEKLRNADNFDRNTIHNRNAQSALDDSLYFLGNGNSIQGQHSSQHQFQHNQLGMSMGMGMVPQFHQQQQQQLKQPLPNIAKSKSGIAFSTEPVLVPGELDILLGRGRGAQNHKGNIHYRNVVETFRARYEQIPQKGAKTQLIREVVAVIYDNGGRFLKQDRFNRWIPVDPEVARDKVSHSFRNQKRLSIGGSNSGKRSRDKD